LPANVIPCMRVGILAELPVAQSVFELMDSATPLWSDPGRDTSNEILL
jgi:hypothetical protein